MLYRLAAEMGIVHLLNPYDDDMPFPLPPSTGNNPMAGLDPTKKGYTISCERIAALISSQRTDAGSENAAHFKEKATELIAGLIMDVGASPIYEGERHLGTVRDIVTSANGRSFWDACQWAIKRGDNYVCQKLASYTEPEAKESKEVMDVLSTARRYTSFLGNECVAPVVSLDGFRWESAKDEKKTIFVTEPAKHLANPGPAKWMQLMVDSGMDALWTTKPGKERVLVVMDEICQYPVERVRSAMNLSRGFGVTLWPIVQSLGDVRAAFGNGWETFVSSSVVKVVLNSDDETTQSCFSKLSGLKTVKVPNYSFGSSSPGWGWPPRMPTTSTSEGVSYGEMSVPVLQPHDIGNIPSNELVMRVRGVNNIIRCKRKPFWECHELDGLWDPDPMEA